MPQNHPYHHYTPRDFAQDPFFRNWMVRPDPESEAFWHTWLEQHPDKQETVEDARWMLLQLKVKEETAPEDRETIVWNKIIRTTQGGDEEHQEQNRRVDQNHKKLFFQLPYQILLGVAAVITMLVLFTGLLFYFFKAEKEELYTTRYGETRTITLPDQSEVVLNANSRLRFSAGLANRPVREVWLDGEAYFSVTKKQNEQKFIVHSSPEVAIEVIGTTFNVNNRRQKTQILLTSGKVHVNVGSAGLKKELVRMEPGELVEIVEAADKRIQKKVVDPQLYASWKDKRLVLRKTSLQELVQLLEDGYGYQVKVADERVLQQTVMGSMPLGSGDQLVEQISKTFGIEMHLDNGTVHIGQPIKQPYREPELRGPR